MWVHSLLLLLLLLFDIRLSREKHEDVEGFTIDAILQTVTCSSFCTIPLEFSSKFLYKISFSSCSNARLLFSVLKEKRCCIQYSQWEMFCKKGIPFLLSLVVVDIRWPVLYEKVILTGGSFFPEYFTRDKNGFVFQGIQVFLCNK